MRLLRNCTVMLALGLASTWAANRLVIHRVQLAGPMGTDRGKMVMVGNELAFVDDTNPDNSFVIPRSDIRTLTLENGDLTMTLAHPFSDMYGGANRAVLHFSDVTSPNMIASWVGLPLATSGEASRMTTVVGPATVTTEAIVNVKYDDDHGKLIITKNGVNFEDLSNADHSRAWSYAQIKNLKQDEDDHEIKIEPYNGDSYKFKVNGTFLTQQVYNMIGNRIVEARGH